MTFGERIKTLRKERKMTQKDLAELAEVTKGTVALWEKGVRNPSLTVVNKLSGIFRRSVDYLLGHTDDNSPIATDWDYACVEDELAESREDYLDFFHLYTRLDIYAQRCIRVLAQQELKRCIEMNSAQADLYEIQISLSPEVIEQAKNAPPDPFLSRKKRSAFEDFAACISLDGPAQKEQ